MATDETTTYEAHLYRDDTPTLYRAGNVIAPHPVFEPETAGWDWSEGDVLDTDGASYRVVAVYERECWDVGGHYRWADVEEV